MIALVFLAVLAIGTPVPVDDALMVGLPVAKAEFIAHGETRQCEGPLLRDVVAKLGAPSGDAVRGPALTQGVLVTARDGYRVVFSLGELDTKLGASAAIVATRCDGKALLTDDGPFRLVVPGEQRAARSARQVATITLVNATAAGD
jgi:hypothetical protein